jgi:SAM-dependent methyltransferase
VTVRAAPEATGPQSAAARYSAPPGPSRVPSVERRPNVARVYDCLLGGSYNFAVDREFAAQVVVAAPQMQRIAWAYRHFLFRAVRCSLHAGIWQFLDVGCGLPSAGSLHEVAERVDPGARVAYVDTDPVAVALTSSVAAGNAGVCAFRGDVRQPEAILAHPELRRLLDLRRPVAVVLGGVLQFIADADDPVGVVGRLLAPLAAGSHLVISHATTDGRLQDWEPVRLLFQQAAASVTARSRAQIERLFHGLPLVDPGLVWLPTWRPEYRIPIEEDAQWSGGLAGIGRKP